MNMKDAKMQRCKDAILLNDFLFRTLNSIFIEENKSMPNKDTVSKPMLLRKKIRKRILKSNLGDRIE